MRVQSKREIQILLRQHSRDLQRLGVRRIGVFGSFVRGEQTERSDVDVIVEFEPGRKSFDNFVKVAELLEDVLGRRVELLTLEALSPYIKKHILGEADFVSLVD